MSNSDRMIRLSEDLFVSMIEGPLSEVDDGQSFVVRRRGQGIGWRDIFLRSRDCFDRWKRVINSRFAGYAKRDETRRGGICIEHLLDDRRWVFLQIEDRQQSESQNQIDQSRHKRLESRP